MGKGGRATGEPLHFELLRGGEPADPESFLREPS
jgi:murein DD-endopeptidase MepM/ murein hydrolase activator NlpD